MDPEAARTAGLAATCSACHGTDGRSAADSPVPNLAGRPVTELRDRLKEFKASARAGTVMPQIAKGYSDAQIERLAIYFSMRPAR